MATFLDATNNGLKTLVGLWNGGGAFGDCGDHGGCFWMAANFFHTAIDSMVKVGLERDPYNIAAEALTLFEKYIPDTTNPRGWRGKYGFWVDDYGWWGIAFMRAYSASDALHYDPTTKGKFASYAKNCWEALNACWDSDQIKWQKDGRDYIITGGIPNTLQSELPLAGRNCVTNECYWRLSTTLGQNFGSHYLDCNANANDFFLQARSQSILFDSSLLVYERFLGLPGTKHPQWTWLGDQGLFAMCCYINGQGKPGIFDGAQAESIIKAVQKQKRTATGVLHEELSQYTQYQLDYACGKGTFMRNLASINDDIHNGSTGSNYDSYIGLNATHVWKNRQSGDMFPYYWDAESPEPTSWGYRQDTANAVLHAAGLSALNAALPWLQNQPID